MRDPSSHSWHETLMRFPGLTQRYPLADSSEWENGAEAEELNSATAAKNAGEGDCDLVAEANAGAAAAAAALAEPDGGAKTEETASRGWRSPPRSPAGAAQSPTGTSTRSSPSNRGAAAIHQAAPDVGGNASARAGSTPARFAPPARAAQAAVPAAHDERYQAMRTGAVHRGGHSAPCTPAQGRAQATPYSMNSRNGGHAWPRSLPTEDLSAAWAEVEQVRQSLIRRERELSHREAGVQRAEARNTAAARQLGELRVRLDDYSGELEQSAVALSAQQQSVREERRQTLEMQARVRRMCAAAVRDDVVASKARDWQRAWTPTQTMGP